MKIASSAFRISASFFVSVLTLYPQGQQVLKQNVPYRCQGETIVVGRCRRDSDTPDMPRTPDSMNYCQIVYPDRPKRNGLTIEGVELRSDIEKKLQACGALSASTSTATVGGAKTSPTNDPSIAKARAAKVDTSALGMQLGEPLRIPNCPSALSGIFNPQVMTQNCRTSFEDIEVLGGIFGVNEKLDKNTGEGTDTVQLAEDYCPSWANVCSAQVSLRNFSIVAVEILTKGRNVAKTVTNELIAKYGKPTRVVLGEVTPDVGNAFKISEPEWTLPGLRVEYEIVIRTENEDRIKTDQGIVRIMLESEHQRRLAEKAKPAKRKL